jgi:hypothetical protein
VNNSQYLVPQYAPSGWKTISTALIPAQYKKTNRQANPPLNSSIHSPLGIMSLGRDPDKDEVLNKDMNKEEVLNSPEGSQESGFVSHQSSDPPWWKERKRTRPWFDKPQ